MYSELYETWKKELQNNELQKLPSDFYQKITDYLKKLKEDTRMLDRRTAKAKLLRDETRNARRMLMELLRTRYWKLVKKATKGDEVSNEALTSEEEKILKGFSPLADAYQTFAMNLFQGRLSQVDVRREQKTVVLRFVKEVPAIMGVDMKPYGPFQVEDIASVPLENAKVLIKQALAEKVEVG